MAYDESLAERVRGVLEHRADVEEKKMFGGVAFFLGGKVCCGVYRSHLLLRLGKVGAEEALTHPDAKPFDITGKAMRGWVMIGPPGITDDESLADWIAPAIAFTVTLSET